MVRAVTENWGRLLLAVAGVAGLAGTVPAAGETLHVLPLGDSITSGWTVPGGYRTYLYNDLTAAGVDVDFVGWLNTNPHPDLPDPDHSGYNGWRIDQINS